MWADQRVLVCAVLAVKYCPKRAVLADVSNKHTGVHEEIEISPPNLSEGDSLRSPIITTPPPTIMSTLTNRIWYHESDSLTLHKTLVIQPIRQVHFCGIIEIQLCSATEKPVG